MERSDISHEAEFILSEARDLIRRRESMHKEDVKIDCPIFQKQELTIKGFIDKINLAKGVREKAENALELQKEADVLLACADYDDKSLNCNNCHFIANLRKQTAHLIIKAKKLA